MKAHTDLVRLVPHLRRYARAVLVDREAADAGVTAALRAVVAAPPVDALPPSVELFRALHRTLARAPEPAAGDGRASEPVSPLEAALRALDRVERAVLLLYSLEHFEPATIAAILDLPVVEVERRLAAAYAGLKGVRRGRVLVCQEDPILADALARAVREAGHDVVGIAADQRAAASLVQSAAADLVFTEVTGGDEPPRSEAIAAVRRLVDVGCVVVTAGGEATLSRLGELPVVVVAKPIDTRLLGIAFANALRHVPQGRAEG